MSAWRPRSRPQPPSRSRSCCCAIFVYLTIGGGFLEDGADTVVYTPQVADSAGQR
ncbi:hypothetical protein NXT3_PC00813 (plasmid) [Sinorhizobium fredii]|uniref:Uncharacterized protein n=1 Tax=Rhizobium fredii TaxID=380 RepID=A0A2L0HES4_RHIFR|nr:hypothetical protein NXT3_PC00813 [Sinorhizobium fredii]